MKTQEIRDRWGGLLFTTQVEDDDEFPVRTALERARLDGASLVNASLDGARLDGARLDGARLVNASLDGASLDGASLVNARLDGASLDGASLVNASLDGARLVNASLDGARLVNASLDGARLVNASLDGASLVNASLDGARLDGASLDGARLVNASLDGARLDGARLDGIRDDFRSVLDTSPNEVAGLLSKLRAGEVDGSQYQGECACLVGTIANIRGISYESIPGLAPNAARASERWFLGIRRGGTPDNNQLAAITDDWICEWQAERGEGDWIVTP